MRKDDNNYHSLFFAADKYKIYFSAVFISLLPVHNAANNYFAC
jgi:hypothetical protein